MVVPAATHEARDKPAARSRSGCPKTMGWDGSCACGIGQTRVQCRTTDQCLASRGGASYAVGWPKAHKKHLMTRAETEYQAKLEQFASTQLNLAWQFVLWKCPFAQ